MQQALRTAINRFPWLKAHLKRLRDVFMSGASVSSHYIEMKPAEIDTEATRLRSAWQADGLPRRQRALVDRQLEDYRRGLPVDVFDVLVRALRELPEMRSGMSVLEIGCSSGFYSEVLEIAELPLTYTGCDYSEAFIALARENYPALRFDVEDATALRYRDGAFDVVISGCCLLHIPEYEQAVAETARVARHYAIFHRTPVVIGPPNRYFRKQAYGVETVEIHFNEPQFLALLEQHGLKLEATYTLSEEWDVHDPQIGSANRTYVCRKITQ
ncbi:MAG: class I SAM-dependent methyltransferase [Gammaproteobacteria bacterium]